MSCEHRHRHVTAFPRSHCYPVLAAGRPSMIICFLGAWWARNGCSGKDPSCSNSFRLFWYPNKAVLRLIASGLSWIYNPSKSNGSSEESSCDHPKCPLSGLHFPGLPEHPLRVLTLTPRVLVCSHCKVRGTACIVGVFEFWLEFQLKVELHSILNILYMKYKLPQNTGNSW